MMQLHISPSMRSITISSSKVAARHISYRTLFHTILILAFLLPFVFILTALVTLEGANKCSSIGKIKITSFQDPLFWIRIFLSMLTKKFASFQCPLSQASCCDRTRMGLKSIKFCFVFFGFFLLGPPLVKFCRILLLKELYI